MASLISASKTFEFTFNTAITPTDVTNQMAAVTNLFYLNNVLHDKLRRARLYRGCRQFPGEQLRAGWASVTTR